MFCFLSFAAGLGIEPRFMDSESIFLPLEDLPIYGKILHQKTTFYNRVVKFPELKNAALPQQEILLPDNASDLN